MSTHSSIAILNKDGTVDMSYCQHDGYLINGVGETLLNHYKDAQAVKDLIKGGAIDELGATMQSNKFYGRNENCGSFKSIDEYHEVEKEEYNYLFDEKSGSWSYNKGYAQAISFKPLTQEAIKSECEKVVYTFIKTRDWDADEAQRRKGLIEKYLVKGADFENVKKMIKPVELNKEVSQFAQEKFDFAQTVADKISLKNGLETKFAQQAQATKQPLDPYEQMMKTLGIEAKTKQEQVLTKDGSRKI